MSFKVRNIFRINRKSLFATLGGFETSGAFFKGILIFEAQWADWGWGQLADFS